MGKKSAFSTSRFKKISEKSKGKFKKISERSKSEFKQRKEVRGVNLGGGKAGPNQERRRKDGYVEYLRGMSGRNKSVPLTPAQWKKSGREL